MLTFFCCLLICSESVYYTVCALPRPCLLLTDLFVHLISPLITTG